jgi:hypothetical protein
MIVLFLSGFTAIPVAAELKWLIQYLPSKSVPALLFKNVLDGYLDVQEKYEFLLYGYDWLAFAHFVLAILFIGPYRKPVQNIWVIQFGLIACVLVIPFALVAGYFRGLPLWWRIGDCAFGIIGFAVLWPCYKKVLRISSTSTYSLIPS